MARDWADCPACRHSRHGCGRRLPAAARAARDHNAENLFKAEYSHAIRVIILHDKIFSGVSSSTPWQATVMSRFAGQKSRQLPTRAPLTTMIRFLLRRLMDQLP